MNLGTLPSELIAKVAGYMEYSEVRNLMRTNKRIHNAIKYFGKDKISPSHLRLSMEDDIFTCVASGDAYANYDSFSVKKNYKFDNGRLGTNVVENIALILSECCYISEMDFYGMPVNRDILKMLNASTTKIGSISFISSPIESGVEEFITFVQKYGICHSKNSFFPDSFWNDEVFVKIVPHIIFEQYPDEVLRHCSRKGLTDISLMKVFQHANYFDIPGIETSFTIEGIVKGIQMYCKGDKRMFVYLQLGVLPFRELQAADRYFNKETGELKDLCKISVSDYDYGYAVSQRNYKLEFGDGIESKNNVYFSVLKPIE